MSFRDEVTAAQARVDRLQRRLDTAQEQLASARALLAEAVSSRLRGRSVTVAALGHPFLEPPQRVQDHQCTGIANQNQHREGDRDFESLADHPAKLHCFCHAHRHARIIVSEAGPKNRYFSRLTHMV